MPPSDQPHRLSKLAEKLVGDLRGVAPDDPPRSRPRATQPLSAIVEQLTAKYHLGSESAEQRLRDRWPDIVGSANAAFSHAARIERNRLVVLASHAVVRNELFLHRDEILQRVHQVQGCTAIKSLLIRAG
ncbi:MAG TPA: DUF721 domain-containing protein [Opitutus sp.]|nr:DUF721 domain-containing protein [Opitutus sp.]